MTFFFQLMNSELAALQEKLEETEQRKEKIDQFLINSKGIYRQQVRLIDQDNEILARFSHKMCVSDVLFVHSVTSSVLTINFGIACVSSGVNGERVGQPSPHPLNPCSVHPLPRFTPSTQANSGRKSVA